MSRKDRQLLSLSVRMASCALIWLTVSVLLELANVKALNGLYAVWGLTQANASAAPAWAAFLVAIDDQAVGILRDILTVGLTCAAAKRLLPVEKTAGRGRGIPLALLGLLAGLLPVCVCLLTDETRLEWPLHAPRFSAESVLALLAALTGSARSLALLLRVVYLPLSSQIDRRGALLVAALAGLLISLPPAGVPEALILLSMTAALCLACERRGYAGAFLLLFGWKCASALVAGQGGALYRMYAVSEPWLQGALGALNWVCILLYFWLKTMAKRKEEPQSRA